MKHFPTILGHEIRMLLVNPSTYIAAVMFLGVMGFVFTGILESYSKAAQDVSPAHVFFELYFLPVFFMVPLLTMKCLADERRLGTIETLLTTPVSTTEVVLGKYGAAYFLYLLLWGSTGGFFYILHRFAGDARFLDSGPLIGGYLFIAVSGLFFIAIGVFASSLSRNQAVAGILCFTMLFALIIGLRFLPEVQAINADALRPLKSAIDYAQVGQHLDDFTRGVVDTRQLLFYLSGSVLTLIFSILSVEAKLLQQLMSTFDSFRTARWLRTLNLVLQAVLFLTFFFGLNYLSLHHPWRFDLTQHRHFSLSPETLSWLRNLKSPVRVIVTIPEEPENAELAAALIDIRGLLREYVYATAANYDPKTKYDGRVTTEYLDVYQRRREADQLGIDQPNSIVLLCGDKRRVVLLGDLYRVRNRQREAFQGEQAITAALLEVSNPVRKKIYFLTGHGELRPDDPDPARGLSALRDELRLRNFDLDLLDFNTTRRVPDNAAVVIAAAPLGIEPFAQEQLRQYLTTRAGRLILLLAPGQPHGLDNLLLDDWGVQVDDDLVCDSDQNSITENGDTVLSWQQMDRAHPITQTLVNYQIDLRIGPARSVRPYPIHLSGSGLTVTTLAYTSASAWGERSYNSGRAPEYTPGVDFKGDPKRDYRLGVIIASERVGARGNLDFSVPRGRLVVFGTADLVTNNRLGNPGNQNIFFAAVNWVADRDTQLNIPARPIERFQLSLSAGELLKLRYSLLLALPGAAALLGLAVYWSRRS